MRIVLTALCICAGLFQSLMAQDEPVRPLQQANRPLVYRSDTLPMMMIPQVNIYDVSKYNYLKSRKYWREIRNVKKVYPYSVIANHRKKEQREYLSKAEREIMNEFEDELKKLTVTQGIILVKLIDRETGQTSYEVVKDLRGGLTAFFWQRIAKLFGNDLKLQYDSEGEDQLIEDIIMAIEHGFI